VADTKQQIAAALTRCGLIGPEIPLDPHESWLLDAALALFQEGASIETILKLATSADAITRLELSSVLSALRENTPEQAVLSQQSVRQREVTKLVAAVRHIHVVRSIRDNYT